jgi:hypothetical protein
MQRRYLLAAGMAQTEEKIYEIRTALLCHQDFLLFLALIGQIQRLVL